jgi:protocatechuate 3,4-dioxygenase beta subunit
MNPALHRSGAILLGLCVAWLAPAGRAGADVVRGFVRDVQGQPIFNADFNVYDANTAFKYPASDKSDATGAYKLVLDPGRYDLLCQVKDPNRGYAPEIERSVLVSGTIKLDYVLPPSVQVRGRVFRAGDGSPVDSCNLDFDRTDDGARQPSIGNITSPFGTFIDYIEAGSYTITANPPDTALAPTRVYRWVVPTSEILLLPVVPAAFISGTIRDADGAPVAGAILRFDDTTGVRHPGTKSPSDSSGFFRVGVEPGVYRVTVELRARANLAAIHVPGVDLTTSRSMDFTLPRGVAVSGLVTDRQGRPVAQADWDAIAEGNGAIATTPNDNTGYDGRYRFVVTPGIYRLRLTPPASSGLDSVVFERVALVRDTTIVVDYAALTGAGSPVLRFAPAGNPTHSAASVALVLGRPVAHARIEIYDVGGRRVRVLADGPLPAGSQPMTWDGRREGGARAHSGIYFVRARLDAHELVTRFVLLP